MDYEISYSNLKKLAAYYEEHAADRNEATTRLHLIDRLFFECLGWTRDDCEAEEPHGNEYTDYTFSTTRRVLILEAKREGEYYELPAGPKKKEYAITTLCRDNTRLREAIRQVAGYCQTRGVPLAAVCNGYQIVAFFATRSDGMAPLDGKALVFPSYSAMLDDFKALWNYLSKDGVREGLLQRHLSQNHESPLPPKLAVFITGYPGFKGRNPFQTDLNILSELVLEDLPRSRELEGEFLRECYCQSGALSQYALVSKQLLKARYEALFDSHSSSPTLVSATDKSGISPELVAEGLSRRPILLIGDVGVGKTTFIRNLAKVEAPSIFEDSFTFYIDLGTQAILSPDLQKFVLEELQQQLLKNYDVDIEYANFVRGVYNLELKRFREGIYGELSESAPDKYKEKELEFLERLLNNRVDHLRASIEHLVKGRQKQVIIFIDNADQRDYEIQQQAFLISQELAESWHATVFVALRPETFHRSMRSGALSGYHPKAFTLSPPRIDRVIDKRLTFAIRLAAGELPIVSHSRPIRANFYNLENILRAFQQSLRDREDLNEAIDNIAGGNVRQALNFVRQFFGSGHVDAEKILNIYESQGSYIVPLHEFLRAIIFGDSKYYDPRQSPVANLFDLTTIDPKEHFLLPILLSVVTSHAMIVGSSGFVEVKGLYSTLQNYGFSPNQIDAAVARAYDKKLVDTSGRQAPEPEKDIPEAIRISTIGVYHLQKLMHTFSYIDAILVDTPILLEEFRGRIRDVDNISDRLDRVEAFRQYLDQQWEHSSISSDVFDWKQVSSVLYAEDERVREKALG